MYQLAIEPILKWPFHNPPFYRTAESISIFKSPRSDEDSPAFVLKDQVSLSIGSAAIRNDVKPNSLWLEYSYRNRVGQPFSQIRKGILLVDVGKRIEQVLEIELGRTFQSAPITCTSSTSFVFSAGEVKARRRISGIHWESQLKSTAPYSKEEELTYLLQGSQFVLQPPPAGTLPSSDSPDAIRVELQRLSPIIHRSECERADAWLAGKPVLERLFANLGQKVEIEDAGEFSGLYMFMSWYSMPDEHLPKILATMKVSTRKELIEKLLGGNPLSSIPWDKSIWSAEKNKSGGENIRYRLFKDFKKKFQVLGMSRAELLQHLGPPDSDGDSGPSYDMGLEPGFIRIDNASLDFVIFEGKVIGYSFVQH